MVHYKTLHENKWVSLREWASTGYVYSHETRCDGEIIAVLPFTKKPFTYLQRMEATPCHEGLRIKATSITGGVDNGDVKGTVIGELIEEAGIEASVDELIYLGWIYPSKSQDTKVHLFAIDITGKSIGEANGDGSVHERNAYCTIETNPQAFFTSTDPFNPLIFMRLMAGGHI